MTPPESKLLRAARWLAFGSAVAILFSIAISQILLALALAALLISGEKLRLPPIKLPLALFLLGTVLSLVFSGNPAAGLPQIRKFYVFLQLLAVFSTLRDIAVLRALVLTWAGTGALIAIRGLVQFAGRVQEAHQRGINFYDYYAPAERMTGFMSHWMTFSGQEMFAFLMLGAFLLFAPVRGKRNLIWIVWAALMDELPMPGSYTHLTYADRNCLHGVAARPAVADFPRSVAAHGARRLPASPVRNHSVSVRLRARQGGPGPWPR